MLITAQYREDNAERHRDGPHYGTSGAHYASHVADFIKRFDAETVLDYGCGKGTLAAALAPLKVAEYDPAIPGKDGAPEPADLVVCTDVLEHVEPECVEAVLDHLRDLTRKAAFFVVATVPAMKHFKDGRNLHAVVQPAGWWLPQIIARWKLLEFHDAGKAFACVVSAR